MLKSIVNMAHELDMDVVAEGVSEEDTATELRKIGCDFVQSYMFGEPLGFEAVLKVLKEQNSR